MMGFWADGNGTNRKGHANELGVIGAGAALRSPRFMAKTMVISTEKEVCRRVSGLGVGLGSPWVGGAL